MVLFLNPARSAILRLLTRGLSLGPYEIDLQMRTLKRGGMVKLKDASVLRGMGVGGWWAVAASRISELKSQCIPQHTRRGPRLSNLKSVTGHG